VRIRDAAALQAVATHWLASPAPGQGLRDGAAYPGARGTGPAGSSGFNSVGLSGEYGPEVDRRTRTATGPESRPQFPSFV
jgi:hypothetical protein